MQAPAESSGDVGTIKNVVAWRLLHLKNAAVAVGNRPTSRSVHKPIIYCAYRQHGMALERFVYREPGVTSLFRLLLDTMTQ